MMVSETWKKSIIEQLAPLLDGFQQGTLNPGRQFRLLVLLARAVQLESPGELLGTLVHRAQELAVVLTLRKEVEFQKLPELLDELLVELQTDEIASAGLHDILIDIDDHLSVLELCHKKSDAQTVAQELAALLSMFLWRLVPLAEWAEGRLQTLPSDSLSATIWRLVSDSPVRAAVDVLLPTVPLVLPGEAELLRKLMSPSKPARVYPLLRGGPVEQAFRVAAAATDVVSAVDDDYHAQYIEDEKVTVQLKLPNAKKIKGPLVLSVQANERVWRHQYQEFSQHSDELWVVLGTPNELAQFGHEARAALGVGPGEALQFELHLGEEEQDGNP
jgi:hypothetical protein